MLIVICSASNTTVLTPQNSTEVSIDTSNKASTGNSEEPEHAPTTVADLANQPVPDTGNTNPPDQIPSVPLDSSTTSGTTLPTSPVTTINLPGAAQGLAINSRLKQLKIPTFDGDKTKFEEYWGLFQSLVDMSMEPISLKMARLRQSLSGRALESIRGLGVTAPEYEEAKEILKSKYGGQRRQLRAYLDELEKMAALNNKDVRGFEKFADLVRVTVVKLKAEGKDGELGDGTLHSLLVKKLTERLLESYTRWLSENSKERSVISLRDWLREEVAIRVEAVEMAYGLDNEDEVPYKGRITKDGGIGKKRSLFSGSGDPRKRNQEGDPDWKRKSRASFVEVRLMVFGPADPFNKSL